MVRRTVIWSFSIAGAAPVANTTVSSPLKRSVTYLVTPSITSMILMALLWSNLLMEFTDKPESSSDLSAALINQWKLLHIKSYHRLEPAQSTFIFFLPLVMTNELPENLIVLYYNISELSRRFRLVRLLFSVRSHSLWRFAYLKSLMMSPAIP